MDLISIAKSKPKKDKSDSKFINAANPERSFERVFFPNAATSVPLAPGTAEYRLLTQIRDEAHRFAITHHRKQRSKQAHQSELEQIPGIGPTIRKRLLTEFGSLTELRKANLDQLKKVKGLRPAAAVALYAFFRGEED